MRPPSILLLPFPCLWAFPMLSCVCSTFLDIVANLYTHVIYIMLVRHFLDIICLVRQIFTLLSAVVYSPTSKRAIGTPTLATIDRKEPTWRPKSIWKERIVMEGVELICIHGDHMALLPDKVSIISTFRGSGYRPLCRDYIGVSLVRRLSFHVQNFPEFVQLQRYLSTSEIVDLHGSLSILNFHRSLYC